MTPAPDIPKPVNVPPPATVASFLRSIFTDHNGDFDMGAVLVGVVVNFMCVNAGFDTIMLHTKFDAQNFGIGIAAVLGGFAAYKYGDAKRADVTATTTTATSTTITPTERPMGPP